jgi:hypothetical protein
VIAVEVRPALGLRFKVVADVFAVVAKGALVEECVVPKEAGRRVGERVAAVVGVTAYETAERLLQVIADIRLIDPGVAVGAESLSDKGDRGP